MKIKAIVLKTSIISNIRDISNFKSDQITDTCKSKHNYSIGVNGFVATRNYKKKKKCNDEIKQTMNSKYRLIDW